MRVGDFVEAYRKYGLWDLVTPEEAAEAVNRLRLGKPIRGELAERVIVKFPWVREAERQLTDKLALAEFSIQYTFVIGSYRSGKSQLKEYLVYKALRSKVLVIEHDFGLRPEPHTFMKSIREAVSRQVDKPEDKQAVIELLDLLTSKRVREEDLADILLLVRDMFGVINLHLDEFEKLRGDLLYRWLDLLTSIHDNMDSGLYSIFYMTGEDLERVQRDKRTERFSTFMKDRVAVMGSYRNYLPEGFGKLTSLVSIARGREFTPEELVFIAELVYLISDRLSKGSLSEANTTIIDIADPAADLFASFSLSKLERELSSFERRFGKGYTKDAGLAFERFVKEVLRKRIATGIQVDDEHLFIEFRPENLNCNGKESDGHILITKRMADTVREVARVPVEVKFSQSKRKVISDWKKLSKCGLLGIIATEPDRVEELMEIRKDLRRYEGPYPIIIIPYTTRLALLSGLSTRADYSHWFDDLERIFLSVWNMDLILYELAVGAKVVQDVVPLPIGEEPPERIVARTVIELIEETKKTRHVDVIKRGVKNQLKRSKKNLSDDAVEQYLNGILARLESADLISLGSRRYRGRNVPIVTKKRWDPIKARELLLTR